VIKEFNENIYSKNEIYHGILATEDMNTVGFLIIKADCTIQPSLEPARDKWSFDAGGTARSINGFPGSGITGRQEGV